MHNHAQALPAFRHGGGQHGAHIHEKADCSSPDAKSAGEHFAPDGHPHGLPPEEPRHPGLSMRRHLTGP